MFNIIGFIAEQKIREEIEKGGFENLEGSGKPLKLEDDSMVPPELRMAYKVLRNGGYLPQEIQEEKDIQSMLDMISHLDDEQEKYRQIRKLNFLVMSLNERRKRPINLEECEYYQEIVEKISTAQKKPE